MKPTPPQPGFREVEISPWQTRLGAQRPVQTAGGERFTQVKPLAALLCLSPGWAPARSLAPRCAPRYISRCGRVAGSAPRCALCPRGRHGDRRGAASMPGLRPGSFTLHVARAPTKGGGEGCERNGGLSCPTV